MAEKENIWLFKKIKFIAFFTDLTMQKAEV